MKNSTFGRTFFTLAEAVIELARAGFNVSVAALCDYALNGLLQLSVLLSGPTPVRFGRLGQSSPAPEVILVSSQEEERAVLAFLATCREAEHSSTNRAPEGRTRWEMVWLPPSSGSIVHSEFQWRLEDDHDENPWHLVDLSYEVEEISGVVDLCLLGDERRMVSDLRYDPANGLHDVRYGIFLRTPDGKICQLQELSDEKSLDACARRRSQELDRFIVARNLPKEKADEIHGWIQNEYLERLFKMTEVPSLGAYMPAPALPEHTKIGVRPTDLDSLVQALKNEDAPAEVTPTNANGLKKSRRETDDPWWEPDPSDPPPRMPVFTPARYFGRQLVAEKPHLFKNKYRLAVAVVEKLHEHEIGRYGNRDEKFKASTLKNAFNKVDLLKPHTPPSRH